jgi:putative SOS response-associated peptidase YedK
MCGRYGFTPGEDFYDRYKVTNRLDYLPVRFNVAPSQNMPVVISQSPNKVAMMKWGLIPYWAKDPGIGFKMINARQETLKDKPSFSRPLRHKRCLVPASFFYEWKKIDNKTKIPYCIKLKTGDMFSFAGLYDIWQDPEGKEVQSYTIITVEPNQLLASIHNRMPAILTTEEETIWLDKNVKDIGLLLNLLKPFSEDRMETYPISQLVNNPENDNAEVIKPIKSNISTKLI